MLILTAVGRPKKAIWGFFRLIPYLIGMGSVLVFCPVARVAEGLSAARELAHIGFLSRVGPQVGLQVLQPAVRLPATLELKERRRLVRLYGLGRFRSRGWEEVIIGGWTPSSNQL